LIGIPFVLLDFRIIDVILHGHYYQRRVTMSEFTNVTVVREANVYFNGGVTSRTIIFPDGTKKTLGIAQPGEYTFTTAAAELMEVLGGTTEVQIADGPWKTVRGGEAFEVPADSRFTMKVTALVDYCCSFLS
jgi:purine/pyrimidine-nucleoside phosphorylase